MINVRAVLDKRWWMVWTAASACHPLPRYRHCSSLFSATQFTVHSLPASLESWSVSPGKIEIQYSILQQTKIIQRFRMSTVLNVLVLHIGYIYICMSVYVYHVCMYACMQLRKDTEARVCINNPSPCVRFRANHEHYVKCQTSHHNEGRFNFSLVMRRRPAFIFSFHDA